jgi:hypothetical protein
MYVNFLFLERRKDNGFRVKMSVFERIGLKITLYRVIMNYEL